MSEAILRTRRWSRVEYDTMIDKGVFRSDERLELLGGELVVREPHGGPHAFAIELAHKALRTAFGPEWRVRVLLPVALDEESEPEPDVSVARGPLRHGSEPKPSRLALVVEIAASSLALERDFKGSLYARAPVPEYWIVNLNGRVLEVYRDPGPDASALYGWAYRTLLTLGPDDHVTPLAAPSAHILVADFLP
jgi:Uma2 family endonuclease